MDDSDGKDWKKRHLEMRIQGRFLTNYSYNYSIINNCIKRFDAFTSSTLMKSSSPWFSMKCLQVVGDSSVRFHRALSVNFNVASTIP